MLLLEKDGCGYGVGEIEQGSERMRREAWCCVRCGLEY
jgi:hypothetical protein